MTRRFEVNGITYEFKDGQFYPMLSLPLKKEYTIGKYGLLHLDYLKVSRKGRYTTLLTEGTLNTYLHEIDVEAHSRLETIISDLAVKRGITEELKASDPLKWVAEMNNIKASAEEVVLQEVIYQ